MAASAQQGHTEIDMGDVVQTNNAAPVGSTETVADTVEHPPAPSLDRHLFLKHINELIELKDCNALLDKLTSSRDEHLGECATKYLREVLVHDEILKTRRVNPKHPFEFEEKKEGRTVLHIAAMQGCFLLAKFILDCLMESCGYNSKGVVQELNGRDAMRDYIGAEDDQSGLTALQMAEDIIGNRSIAEYIKHTLQRVLSKHKVPTEPPVGPVIDPAVTKNPKYPSVHPCLFEAYPHTQWYTALASRNSSELRKLLQYNSRLLLETCDGLSVLHLAVLEDDMQLVDAVLALFADQGQVVWGKSYYPQNLTLRDMVYEKRKIFSLPNSRFVPTHIKVGTGYKLIRPEVQGKIKRRGNTVVAMASVLKRTAIGSKLLGKIESARLNLLNPLESDSAPENKLPSEIKGLTLGTDLSLKDRFVAVKKWLKDLLQQSEYLKASFPKDVDFNFEEDERCAWLLFHCACKDPLKNQSFLQLVYSYISQGTHVEEIKHFLFQMCDAQGRTPFHILLDHYNQEKSPGWAFFEIFTGEKYTDVEDARGRKIVEVLLTKNYLQLNILLEPWSYFGMKFQPFDRGMATFWYYHVAFLLKQTRLTREMWTRFLTKKNMKGIMRAYPIESKASLFIAASTGNQLHLQLLLEAQSDPMVIDTKGISLLHHAADATLLQFQLIAHCFSTVEDVCKLRKKWIEEMYFSHSSSSNPAKPGSSSPANPSSSSSANLGTSDSANPSIQDIARVERSNVGRKACILMLLQAGVDLFQADRDGKVPNLGPTNDEAHQSWWYDLAVKESTSQKNSFNQAGNALSVVGTLVAATSYIGPLQPPMSYTAEGFVKTTEPLVKVFMVSNAVAFYFAMASVMFAAAPSLRMPQEGVISEVKRAYYTVTFSLCLLLAAIASIVISFASTSMVVIQNEHSFHRSDLLFAPSVIGWIICFIGIISFFLRVMRLMLYKSSKIRKFYQFCSTKILLRVLRVGVVVLIFIVVFGQYGIIILLFLRGVYDGWKKIMEKKHDIEYRKFKRPESPYTRME